MTALIISLIAIPLLVVYCWLIYATAYAVHRRSQSRKLAASAIFGILVLTFGDTAFNSWYHRTVLCAHEDVGVTVFEAVAVNEDHWDKNSIAATIDDRNTRESPFLGRYAVTNSYTDGGWYPLTRYQRREFAIIDTKTGKALSRYVNYEPTGGWWWAYPLTLFGEKTLVGWLLSRGRAANCYDYPPHALEIGNPNRLANVSGAIRGAFKLQTERGEK